MVQEEGVFEYLRNSHLEALQIFVVQDNANTQTPIETYSFAFQYKDGRPDTIHFGTNKQTFLTTQIHQGLKVAIRNLLSSLKGLPRLPARIKLGMSLAYTQAWPLLYQPKHFTDAEQDKPLGGRPILDLLWDDGDHSGGNMETSHHHVHTEIRSLAPPSLSSGVQDVAMSKYLRTMQRTSSPHRDSIPSTLQESRSSRPIHPLMSTRK
ncbi:hypothetical protein PV10_01287 [Exophiala mesophila]|uniref:HORMA domain-containing protein n=1 Tax=Exophiala mesophila TaxID=212818 RepID=A0A0D2AF78_EXOME|nr:uncharacterized protein PV10_01287 [Exophiala mesophila]KIV97548.1 hypothetical protein PV10_01287 [Exophiala mesophila]